MFKNMFPLPFYMGIFGRRENFDSSLLTTEFRNGSGALLWFLLLILWEW